MGNSGSKTKKLKVFKPEDRNLGEEENYCLESFKKGKAIESKVVNVREVRFSDLKVICSVGSGGTYSFVYKALWNEQIVSFKCFKHDTIIGEHNLEEFEREASLYLSLIHPNLLHFYGVLIRSPRIGVVTEYCHLGDLEQFIQHHRKFPLTERLRFCLEISSAMQYLHSNEILHRDLRLSRVLVREKVDTCIRNIGINNIVTRGCGWGRRNRGYAIYMSPEASSEEGLIDSRADVFSYAILSYMIITWDLKPYGDNFHNIQFRVKDDPNHRPDIKSIVKNVPKKMNIRRDICDLLESSWSHFPEKRPQSFEEIRNILMGVIERLKIVSGHTDIIYVPTTKPPPSPSTGSSKRSYSQNRSIMRRGREHIPIRPRRSRFQTTDIRRRRRRPSWYRVNLNDGELPPLKLFLRNSESPEDEGDEVELYDRSFQGLREIVCKWAMCEDDDIVKMCKKFERSCLRKITKDSTVTKMEDESVVVVELKEGSFGRKRRGMKAGEMEMMMMDRKERFDFLCEFVLLEDSNIPSRTIIIGQRWKEFNIIRLLFLL